MADDDNRPGIFRRLAVAAPLITGVGVGTRRLLKSSTFSQGYGSFSAPRNNFIRSFGAKVMAGAKSGMNFMSSDLSVMTGKSPDMIKMAWELALQSADPGKVLERHPLDNVDPSSTIKFFAEKNVSVQGNRVLQSFVKQLGSLETHSAASGGAFSPAMFGRVTRHNFIRSNVPVATVEDALLRETLQTIQSTVHQIPGVETNLQLTKRSGMDGAQLMFHMSGGKFGKGVALEIPMELVSQPGVIVHGVTQQTKRIVGKYALTHENRVVSTLKHEQYVARRFLEQVLPQIMHGNSSVSATRKLVTDFNYSNIEGSQWMANLPIGTIPSHDAALNLGGGRRVLLDANFNSLNAERAAYIMANKKNGLFPSTSPAQLSKGIVSTYNAQKFWLGGEGFGWERRPGQALGRGFGPSEKAAAARMTSKVRRQYSWLHTDEYEKMFFNTHMDIMARTAYVSEKKYPGFADQALGGTLGGTGLVSTLLNDQMEHVAPLSLNLSGNAPINKKLLDMATESTFKFAEGTRFEEGEILGYDANRHPITYNPNMKITGGFHYTDTDTPFMRIQGIETLPIEENAKFFGGGKFVSQTVQQIDLEKMIATATGQKVTGQEVVLGIDELRKNRGLHNMQMITAAHDFAYKQMKRNGKTLESTTFNHSLQNMLHKTVATESYNPDEVTKGIYQFARQHELSPFAVGRIFGAVPDVYGDEWKEKMTGLGLQFSPHELSEIDKGIATGVSSFFYGGPGYAGGHGSVEPRFFELLKGKQFGKLGPNMAKDIGNRMILANPEMIQEQSMLGSALSSIVHGVKGMDGVAEYHLNKMKNKDISDILETGGILHTGKVFDNIGSIYVPGSAKSRAMRGYTTGEGISSESVLAHSYEEFMQAGIGISLGKRTRSEGEHATNQLIEQLGIAHSGTITGKGAGFARQQVIGSRYMKAVAGTREELGDLETVGISKRHGVNMFREMEDLYKNDWQQLLGIQSQRERFLAGEAIGVIGRRDPEIGPYSAQPLKMRMIDRLRDTDSLLIPQSTAVLTGHNNEEVARVALGPMPGFAGDYDGDNVHIMLTSSTIEKDIMGHFTAGTTKEHQAYTDYIIRQQLLKAKAPKEFGLTMEEEMIAGTRKNALAKSHVGPLSVPLRELRAGLVEYGGLSDERSSGAFSLLEALEQVPISGKHASAKQIGNLEQQVTQIASAARAGRGDELAHIARDIFKDNPIAQSLLSGESQEFTVNSPDFYMKHVSIKGIDLAQAAEDLAKAVSDYSSQSRGMNDNIARGIMAQRRSLTREGIDSYLQHSGGLLSDFKMGTKGAMSEVAETALSMKNKLLSIGGEIIEHMGKPLALGFGASLAISAILSKPLSNLDPEDGRTPISAGRVNSANTRSIAPENVNVGSEVSGAPTTSSPLNGPSVRYAANDSARVNIRALNQSGANMGTISSMITQRLRGNTNVNVNIRDRKTSLSQQKIDSILRR